MKYKYKTIKIDTSFGIFSGTDFNEIEFNKILDKNGEDRWKLISVNTIERVKGGTKYVIATFMKEIQVIYNNQSAV